MNRPEPRTLPKPLRVLCLFVAALLVCSLGVIVANHQPSTAGDDHGSATDAKQESTGKRKTDSGPRRYAGLEAAGIPVPGDWSQRTTAFPVDTHKDGTRTLSENADGITLHNGSGPIDTALETVDALLDPNGSDDEWRKNVFALLGDDGAGESHPVSDAPRWWWTQRRFHAGSVCSGQYDDKYVNYAYTCTSDGKWEGSDTDAIQSQPFWTTKETSFPIPEGGGPSSTTDPQQTVSQAYNTVLLPMDDGNWHVTVYCPAALDASLLDKDANELDPDQVKAGDEAYTVISATGYGTVQHPCRTVEVVVGGQKPFWSLRNTQ